MPSFDVPLTTVVHDLGNLIQIATSAVRIVARDPAVRTAADLDPLITHATSSLERASALVRQSIGLREPAVRETLRLDVCLGQMKSLLQYACGPAIAIEIAADLPLAIVCRRIDFENAILNLALNASDAMPAGGRLRITTDIAEGPETAEVIVVVTDTGTGMSPEVAERALDPFFTTKPAGRGSGTGLPSVKAFVDEVGGRLLISSTPGRGTDVTLRLPVAGSDYR